jgi:hypothetical protein
MVDSSGRGRGRFEVRGKKCIRAPRSSLRRRLPVRVFGRGSK